MSLLGNLNNSMPSLPFNLPKNPQQLLQMVMGNNQNMKQAMEWAMNMTQNDPNKAKEMALEKFKSVNMNKEQFEQFKQMAKQMGASDDNLKELEKYIN